MTVPYNSEPLETETSRHVGCGGQRSRAVGLDHAQGLVSDAGAMAKYISISSLARQALHNKASGLKDLK